jgi:hypothetical protein
MSFQAEHIGLYFGQSQIRAVQNQHQQHLHLNLAWQWLLTLSGNTVAEIKPKTQPSRQIIKPQLDILGQALEAGFRYRFLEDENAAEQAVSALQMLGFIEQESLLETIQTTMASAHSFEMVREHYDNRQNWLNEFASFTDNVLQRSDDTDFIEQLWLMALTIVSAVVLEDETRFETGTNLFRQMIDKHIHPEGYIKVIVSDEKDAVKAFKEMALACGALALAAEAASQAGQDLWSYEKREVGINTAATYLVYYYFYPDKWRWGVGLTDSDTQAIFREHGAWMDIVCHHFLPRGVELLLEQQRPFFNAYMGGLTTLSHFKIETKGSKRWKLFG